MRRHLISFATLLFIAASHVAAVSQSWLPSKLGQAQTPTPPRTKENPKDGLTYVWIPPGSFQMGCSPGDNDCNDEEKPAHKVRITRGFWIGQTEVTVGAYKRYARSKGLSLPSEPRMWDSPLNAAWNNEVMPMVKMNWTNAHDYCTWAGGRLPTEAEWEYAARGGSTTARYGPLDATAWTADNSGIHKVDSARAITEDPQHFPESFRPYRNTIHEVGQKQANEFGLFDSLGNAWEWVNDWYDDKYYQSSPAADPQGPSSGEYRVLRGGSWIDPPWDARLSYRGASRPDFGGANHGFRCVWKPGSR